MKRPSPWLYFPLAGLLVLFARIKGQKIIQTTKVQGPAFVLTNHTSFYDYIYTIAAAYPSRINFVAADKFFYDPGMSLFLKLARAIPKCLFQPDVRAVKKSLDVIEKGGIVGIFPEGQISPIGKTYDFPKAIGKLIKTAKVPVYLTKHHNAYFSNPPWSKKSFAGPVFTSLELALTSTQIESMEPQEITSFIQSKLAYNASEYNARFHHQYKLNSIEGLEKILYRCPQCFEEGLQAKNHELECPKCGLSLPYTTTGQLGHYRIDDLFQQQRDVISQNLRDNPDYKMVANVKLESYFENRVKEVGQGVLTFCAKEYRYEGIIHGEEKTLVFSPKDIQYFPSDIGINVQIYYDYVLYQFVFPDPISPTRFMIFGEHLYNEFHLKNSRVMVK